LTLLGIWGVLATLVPQGPPSSHAVVEWAERYGGVAPLVKVVGLHRAFGAPIFLVGIGLLALSAVVCAWDRTRVAVGRVRAARRSAQATPEELLDNPDFSVRCATGADAGEVLSDAAEVLAVHGIKTHRSQDMIRSVSSPVAFWGSPVFHWSLVALIAIAALAPVVRAEGLMGLAVGETKPDGPQSYGSVVAGRWHRWDDTPRSYRLDDFEPRFKANGMDVGPVPTVSVLDAEGRVIKTQPVYPNHKLRIGSTAVTAPAFGFAVTVSLRDQAGAEAGRAIHLVDFSQEASEGTLPYGTVPILDQAGNTAATVHVTVPLIRQGDEFVEWLPREATARVVATMADGSLLADEVVEEGGEVRLGDGAALRVESIGWYSRLSIVDDWTIPVIYACMILAATSLAVTAFMRQQLVLATAAETPDGIVLAVRLKLSRNVPTSRHEVESALKQALAGGEGEDAS
jgi:cytochrome c biogenesis protein ResB